MIKNETWVKGASWKTFVMFSAIWLLRGWRVWVNPLKKKKLWQKSLFQLMLNEVLKNWKIILADVKANKNKKKIWWLYLNFYKE